MKAHARVERRMAAGLLAAGLAMVFSSAVRAGDVLVLESARLPQIEAPARTFQVAVGRPCRTLTVEDVRRNGIATDSLPDLVFALGGDALDLALDRYPGVPVVFSMVLDWREHTLDRDRCTGVSLEVDPESLLATYQMFLPGVKRIGTIVSAGGGMAGIRAAEEAARAFDMTLDVARANGGRETFDAFKAMRGGVDALWMGADPEVWTVESFRAVAKACQERGLPLLVFSENFVRAGGLLAVSPNYAHLGDQAAVLARRILDEGETPGALPVEAPIGTSIVLNEEVAASLDLEIPDEMLAMVDLTVDASSRPANLEEGLHDLVGRGGDVGFFALEALIVTSVAKRPQEIGEVAAAITVLTSEDIRRSGARDLSDVLRQVPGLDVASVNGWRRQISARGFTRQFSPNMLVLLDGRPVYTPFFGGMNWDQVGVVLEDIDRIEVIRGPGGTIYGSNAVNGVISIITKTTSETEGGLVRQVIGSRDTLETTVRYGHRGESLGWRVWGQYGSNEGEGGHGGEDVPDAQRARRAGARVDWDVVEGWNLLAEAGWDQADYEAHDMLALGSGAADIEADGVFRTGHALARLSHEFEDGSSAYFQAFTDHIDRLHFPVGSARERYDTYDLELQFDHVLNEVNILTWGFNGRHYKFDVEGQEPTISFDDPMGDLSILSGFLQDEWRLHDDWTVTAGTKVEYHSFVGVQWEPSVRAVWRPAEDHTFWGAISRAIRTPSYVEDQVFAIVGPSTDPANPGFNVAVGNQDLAPEKLLAYEAGYRWRVSPRWKVEVDMFLNRYADLIESAPGGVSPPGFNLLPYDNVGHAKAWGGELVIDGVLSSWARSQLGYAFEQFDVDGGEGLENLSSSAPQHKVTFRQYVDLPWEVEASAALRWTDSISFNAGDLAGPAEIDDYLRLDAQLEKRFTTSRLGDLSVALVGQNLLDPSHPEFLNGLVAPVIEVRRSVYLRLTWRF